MICSKPNKLQNFNPSLDLAFEHQVKGTTQDVWRK